MFFLNQTRWTSSPFTCAGGFGKPVRLETSGGEGRWVIPWATLDELIPWATLDEQKWKVVQGAEIEGAGTARS